MKRIITLVIIGVLSINLMACGNVKDKAKGIETTKTKESVAFNLTEKSDIKGEFKIPNPEKATGKEDIVIHKCKYKKGTESRYCTKEKKEPRYDLSFLGFKNKVRVTNFATGNVTGSGENLILVIKSDSSLNAYLAVLDYNNKKSYCVETDIIAGQGCDEQLNVYDLTGDEKDDLVLSSESNMCIDWNVYNYSENKLNRIYSDSIDKSLGRDGFKTELLDDYKLKITGINFNYSQTISLTDIGVKKEDLEIDNAIHNKSDNENARVYKNGKIKKNAKTTVDIKALMAEKWDKEIAVYSYFNKLGKDRTICTPLTVTLGDDEIGKLNVYIQYNTDAQKLEINKVEFKGTEKNINKQILNVLKNKKKYYNTELKKECYIKDYNSDNYMTVNSKGKYEYQKESNAEKINIQSWCQVDIDSDGEKEVVLKTGTGNEIVLTYKAGKVYSYAFPFRGTKNIKTDGTFESTGSASDTYIGRLKFDNGECYYSEICAADSSNEKSPIYRINNKKTTKEKVDDFLKKQNQKENVVWNKENPIAK